MPRQPDPQASLRRELADMRARLTRLERASSWSLSGTTVTAEGATVTAGSSTIEGSLDVSGSATISGDLTVSGTFSLPNGSVQEDWLASIVKWAAIPSDTQTGWSTSTSLVDKATTSVTVPAGVTSAIVVAWGEVVFQDTAPNRFDCRVVIEGGNGPTVMNLANLVGATTALHSRVLTVSASQVLDVSVQVFTAAATGGLPANQAVISGIVLYQR